MTTTVITLSEYPPEAVLCTVRLYAGLPVHTVSGDFRTVVSQHDEPVRNRMMVAVCIGPPSTRLAGEAMKMKTNSPDAMSRTPLTAKQAPAHPLSRPAESSVTR
jgi:hypothetical protein